MGRKKRKGDDHLNIIWCYYCDRQFADEATLIQHQKAKHFKCESCGKKLSGISGLTIHASQVHKINMSLVPNAKPGRDSVQKEVFGMAGVPPGMRPGGEIDEQVAKRAKLEQQQQQLFQQSVSGVMPPQSISGPYSSTAPYGPVMPPQMQPQLQATPYMPFPGAAPPVGAPPIGPAPYQLPYPPPAFALPPPMGYGIPPMVPGQPFPQGIPPPVGAPPQPPLQNSQFPPPILPQPQLQQQQNGDLQAHVPPRPQQQQQQNFSQQPLVIDIQQSGVQQPLFPVSNSANAMLGSDSKKGKSAADESNSTGQTQVQVQDQLVWSEEDVSPEERRAMGALYRGFLKASLQIPQTPTSA